MNTIKRNWSRWIASGLTAVLLVTNLPLSTIAEANSANSEKEILYFTELPKDVAMQEVAEGTPLDNLVLPEKIEAVISTETTLVVEPETTPESTPETSSEAEPETTPESDPETSSEAEPEMTPESDPETSSEAEPETTPESEPETSSEVEPETVSETTTQQESGMVTVMAVRHENMPRLFAGSSPIMVKSLSATATSSSAVLKTNDDAAGSFDDSDTSKTVAKKTVMVAVEWESEPLYNPSMPGNYVFTAALKSDVYRISCPAGSAAMCP